MPIVPLPVFEKEADPKARGLTDEDIQQYNRLAPPETVVVRYGAMRHIGEFPFGLDFVPGCGTKLVVRTSRGVEIAETLTTACGNGGCGKSLTRKEILDYVERSGGHQYPFSTRGQVLRLAGPDDLTRWEALRAQAKEMARTVKRIVAEQRLEMKVVEVEPIFGGEVLTVFYLSEERVDFRNLVRDLAGVFQTRIEMRQVGARDEARLTADYERCGQHCCCKQFLKVLKPVSMRAAKIQKATLDPLKISGRCGRLMCCLRYEEATYDELKKRLPHRRTRVGTPEGPGIVIDGQILTQLVLVELERDGSRIAVPVENLMPPDECPSPDRPVEEDALRGMKPERVAERVGGRRRGRTKDEQQDAYRRQAEADATGPDEVAAGESAAGEAPGKKRRRRKRRRKKSGEGAAAEAPTPTAEPTPPPPSAEAGSSPEGEPRRKKRRRRRRRRPGGGDQEGNQGGDQGSAGGSE